MSSSSVKYIKFLVSATALTVGGCLLVQYIQPSPEELIKKFSPERRAEFEKRRSEIQRLSLERIDKIKSDANASIFSHNNDLGQVSSSEKELHDQEYFNTEAMKESSKPARTTNEK